MRELQIKGNTTEEKFAHLEIILRRMGRRLHRTVIGLIPASPIFGYCENSVRDPIVLRAVFPADGIITQAAMKAEKFSKGAQLMVSIVSGDRKVIESFPFKKQVVVQEVNFHVDAGDSLEVWVTDSDEEEGSTGVWVGFLYQVGMKDLASTELLIDQFEALIEGGEDASES